VALSDPEDHEALNVFVISSARELYTFTLRPEFFRRSASIDETIADWCKISRPAPFNFAFPHRIHASSPLELFISLDSGALLRLTRKAGEDGR
jgi:nuclear pore complex protein Nup160